MCSGKEQLKRNLHRSSKGAPKRKEKMKKTIAILLVLVIGMVGVFAANVNQDTLQLTSQVSGKYGLKIATAAATGANLGALITSFGDLTEVSSTLFTDNDLTETVYINYMSNIKNKATVTTTMTPMISQTVATQIGYSVIVGGTVPHEVSAGTEESPVTLDVTFIEDAEVMNGMRVVSKSVKIDVDSAEWQAAGAATDYTTTWTVNLKTN